MGNQTFSAADTIARAFVGARQAHRRLPEYPGVAPSSLADAYQVQAVAIGLMGDRVGGWKIGRIPAPLDETYGADRLVGPIFASTIIEDAGGQPAMPVFSDGFAAAEAEYLLRIAAPVPVRADGYTADRAAELIDAVHVGIEIASSPYPMINADGPAVTVSDFGNNNGLVVGGAIPNWADGDINAWPVELLVNGKLVGSGRSATMLDGPFGAAAFLFNLAAERGLELSTGQWISSGAVTGVHPVAVGDHVAASFLDGRSVACRIASY